jgi:hypothetical protein
MLTAYPQRYLPVRIPRPGRNRRQLCSRSQQQSLLLTQGTVRHHRHAQFSTSLQQAKLLHLEGEGRILHLDTVDGVDLVRTSECGFRDFGETDVLDFALADRR